MNIDYAFIEKRILELHAGMKHTVGDLAIYQGRLVEVSDLDWHGNPSAVWFSDESGHRRRLWIHGPWVLERLIAEGQTILDGVMKATTEKLSTKQRLNRIAEVWFSDPKGGDVFCGSGLVYEVMSVSSTWEIKVEASSVDLRSTGWQTRNLTFKNVDDFRAAFYRLDGPGYTVRAHATLRPDYPTLHRSALPESSPLFIGGLE